MINCQMVNMIMKKTYIIPAVNVHHISVADGLLQSVSTNVVGTGTTTSIGNVTESDVKEDSGWDLFD